MQINLAAGRCGNCFTRVTLRGSSVCLIMWSWDSSNPSRQASNYSIRSWQNQSVSREQTDRRREKERETGGGRTRMKETAGRQICCRAFNQNKPQEREKWTAGSEEHNRWFDREETKDWTHVQTELMRGWVAGGGTQVRGMRRKAADWLGGTPETKPKTMQSSCGGENIDLSAYIPAGMSEYLYKLLAFNFKMICPCFLYLQWKLSTL